MSKCLTSLFRNFDNNDNCKEIAFPDDESRAIARAWYTRYADNKSIEDEKLIELLSFMYSHYDLDSYELSHYIRVAEHLNNTYDISRNKLPEMIAAFREFL